MSNTQKGKYLYLANSYYDGRIFTKIGTTVNIKTRLRPIITNSPLIINSIFYTYKKWPKEAFALEKILQYFMNNNIHHEWFKADESFFQSVEKLLEKFTGYLSWEDQHDYLVTLEKSIPSLRKLMDETFELLAHFSEIEWIANEYHIVKNRMKLKSTKPIYDYLEMHKIITNGVNGA